jgi:hypothetical protein
MKGKAGMPYSWLSFSTRVQLKDLYCIISLGFPADDIIRLSFSGAETSNGVSDPWLE